MAINHLAYLELPATDVAALKDFYGPLFGWTFQDWGPDYVAFAHAGLDGGFNASNEGKPAAPLPIIETDAIEQMEERVRAAGATITLATFSYAGGRRFHFLDPAGNELAVMQPDAAL